MSETPPPGPPDGIGNVGEEAAKLLGALSDWTRDQGSDVGQGLGGMASQAAASLHDINEHLATGSAECTYCPVCRTVHAVRQTSPEVRAHLTQAATSLLHAAAGFLATLAASGRFGARPGCGADRPRRGRPGDRQMTLTCGVDVGGTKIAGAVVDTEGKVLEEHRVESPATDTEAIEVAIADLVTELGSRHKIEAVGVGAAGYISASRSVVMFAPNLAWRDVDLKAELEERVDVPVVVENDANAAAWGEFRFGAAADADDLLLVTVGTGVGGGIVLDGELFRGSFGAAAEIGHIRVVPDGPPVRLRSAGLPGAVRQWLGAREGRARGSAHPGGGGAARRGRWRPGTDRRTDDHRAGAAGRRVRPGEARRDRPLARRRDCIPGRGAGPRRRGDRWWRQRRRGPAPRPDP